MLQGQRKTNPLDERIQALEHEAFELMFKLKVRRVFGSRLRRDLLQQSLDATLDKLQSLYERINHADNV